jgi:hypothetical protein
MIDEGRVRCVTWMRCDGVGSLARRQIHRDRQVRACVDGDGHRIRDGECAVGNDHRRVPTERECLDRACLDRIRARSPVRWKCNVDGSNG